MTVDRNSGGLRSDGVLHRIFEGCLTFAGRLGGSQQRRQQTGPSWAPFSTLKKDNARTSVAKRWCPGLPLPTMGPGDATTVERLDEPMAVAHLANHSQTQDIAQAAKYDAQLAASSQERACSRSKDYTINGDGRVLFVERRDPLPAGGERVTLRGFLP